MTAWRETDSLRDWGERMGAIASLGLASVGLPLLWQLTASGLVKWSLAVCAVIGAGTYLGCLTLAVAVDSTAVVDWLDRGSVARRVPRRRLKWSARRRRALWKIGLLIGMLWSLGWTVRLAVIAIEKFPY
jgi:hypothetical protein